MNRDTSAFSRVAGPGTLTTPAGYTGNSAPITGGTNPDDSRLKVEKAVNSMSSSNGAPASDEAESVKNTSATMVIGGLVLLWIFGGIVFKNARV
jgi:hypothetical protein